MIISALSSLSHLGGVLTKVVLPPLTTSTSIIAKNFFRNLFLNPFDHIIPIGFFAVILIAGIVGIVFLIKKFYESRVNAAT